MGTGTYSKKKVNEKYMNACQRLLLNQREGFKTLHKLLAVPIRDKHPGSEFFHPGALVKKISDPDERI